LLDADILTASGNEIVYSFLPAFLFAFLILILKNYQKQAQWNLNGFGYCQCTTFEEFEIVGKIKNEK